MIKVIPSTTTLWSKSLTTTERLIDHLNVAADDTTVRNLLARLQEVLGMLPPDCGYRASVLAGLHQMWTAGERFAVRWQLVQLGRRLKAEETSWTHAAELPSLRKRRFRAAKWQ